MAKSLRRIDRVLSREKLREKITRRYAEVPSEGTRKDGSIFTKSSREPVLRKIEERRGARSEAHELAGASLTTSRRPVIENYADALKEKFDASSVRIDTRGVSHTIGTETAAQQQTARKTVSELNRTYSENGRKILLHIAHNNGHSTISARIDPNTHVFINFPNRTELAEHVDSLLPYLRSLRKQMSLVHNLERQGLNPTTGLGDGHRMADYENILKNKVDKWNRYSLGFFDLVKFKSPNDKFGMPIGDALLHINAKIHAATARRADALFTPTGDEVYLLADSNDHESLKDRYTARLDANANAMWRSKSIRKRLKELAMHKVVEEGKPLISDEKILEVEKEMNEVLTKHAKKGFKALGTWFKRNYTSNPYGITLDNVHELLNRHHANQTNQEERGVVHALASNPKTQWLIGLQLYNRSAYTPLKEHGSIKAAEVAMGDVIKSGKQAFAAHWGMPVERTA